ncbi:hypothetical protein HDU93_001274 [Gonapodya sp. JEL0774]|nr:hypothetical protein HDU93_001274 [Gonapodya sp. JEL0774]
MLGGEMPKYKFNCSIKTVPDGWSEYIDGHTGGPPVKELEKHFGAQWRVGDSRFACRRKVLYKAIEDLKEKEGGVERAVEALETRRLDEKWSLDKLQKELIKEQSSK